MIPLGFLNSKIKLEEVLFNSYVTSSGMFNSLCYTNNPITLYSKGSGPFYSRTWYVDSEGAILAHNLWLRHGTTRWNVFYGEFISAPDCE